MKLRDGYFIATLRKLKLVGVCVCVWFKECSFLVNNIAVNAARVFQPSRCEKKNRCNRVLKKKGLLLFSALVVSVCSSRKHATFVFFFLYRSVACVFKHMRCSRAMSQPGWWVAFLNQRRNVGCFLKHTASFLVRTIDAAKYEICAFFLCSCRNGAFVAGYSYLRLAWLGSLATGEDFLASDSRPAVANQGFAC